MDYDVISLSSDARSLIDSLFTSDSTSECEEAFDFHQQLDHIFSRASSCGSSISTINTDEQNLIDEDLIRHLPIDKQVRLLEKIARKKLKLEHEREMERMRIGTEAYQKTLDANTRMRELELMKFYQTKPKSLKNFITSTFQMSVANWNRFCFFLYTAIKEGVVKSWNMFVWCVFYIYDKLKI